MDNRQRPASRSSESAPPSRSRPDTGEYSQTSSVLEPHEQRSPIPFRANQRALALHPAQLPSAAARIVTSEEKLRHSDNQRAPTPVGARRLRKAGTSRGTSHDGRRGRWHPD